MNYDHGMGWDEVIEGEKGLRTLRLNAQIQAPVCILVASHYVKLTIDAEAEAEACPDRGI